MRIIIQILRGIAILIALVIYCFFVMVLPAVILLAFVLGVSAYFDIPLGVVVAMIGIIVILLVTGYLLGNETKR